MYVFTQPLRHGRDVTFGQFLSREQHIWIQGFLFPSLIVVQRQELGLLYYLPIAGGDGKRETDLFSKWIARSEKQIALARIRNSVSYSK